MAFRFKHGDRPLDGYQILRGVGRGGFGEVYYAISDGGREVALKYLRENPEVELRGISSCINLKSPHLVSIFDVKQNADGEYFVIMEYVSGPSMRDLLIAEPNGLGPQKAAFFVREIAKGLAYLHDRGIVHRDLKPGNIFYEDGYVKICDYGLSKYISVSRHSAQTASVGTVHYMAPEVGSGNYSKTIDIYAVGVILYEMLLGRVPYEGASMGEVLMKHLTSQPEVDQLPQPFAEVIRRALAKDPKDRFVSINEMVEAIFGQEDVRRSVLGFEPASLSQVAARAAQELRPSPARSDNPIPPLQRPRPRVAPARDAAEFSRRFVERTARLNPRLGRKERRRLKKGRSARARANPLGVEDAGTQEHSSGVLSFGQRLARTFTALLVMAGASVIIGVISKDGALAAMSLGIVAVATLGIAVARKIVIFLGPDHPWLVGRILTVGCTAPAAALLYAGCPIETALGPGQQLYVPMLAMIGLLNWEERIRSGARGQLGWWEACVAAFWAFMCVRVFHRGGGEDGAFYLAGIAAAISFAVQIWSWALARTPQRDGEEEATLAPPEAPPGLEETRWAAPPAPVVQATAGAMPSQRLSATPLKSDDAPRAWRSRPVRVLAGVLGGAAALVAMVLFIALCAGEFHAADEASAAIVAIAGLLLFSAFSFGKTRRLRRGGLWSAWINPLLRIPAGMAVALPICLLSMMSLDGGELAVTIGVLVVAALGMLFLLVTCRRGAKTRASAAVETASLEDHVYGRTAVPSNASPRDVFIIPGPSHKT